MVWTMPIARHRRSASARRRGFAAAKKANGGGKTRETTAPEEAEFPLCPEFAGYIIQEYILGHEAVLPVESDKTEPLHGEIALWRAVITQALMDALNRSAKCEMRYEKSQAGVWLEGRMEDFFTVCHYAQLDPAYVREKARRVLAASRRTRGRKDGARGEKQKAATGGGPIPSRLL